MSKVRTKQEWMTLLEDLYKVEKALPWTLGETMNAFLDEHCTNNDQRADLYDEVVEQLEMSKGTLKNYTSAARRWPDPESRRERLTIHHHINVMGMEDSQAEYWLDQAEMNGWSVAKMRVEIHKPRDNDGEDPDLSYELPVELRRWWWGHGINVLQRKDSITFQYANTTVRLEGKDMRWVTATD